MADSNKSIRRKGTPAGNKAIAGGNPECYYDKHPSWNFASCDTEKWSIQFDDVRSIFWDEIFPRFQALERQTWSDILISSKKSNHSIITSELNKAAADRLAELYVEAESIVSLRVNGTHRIYGYMNGSVFNVLWVDLNHGDNARCVCRSYKKHT